MNRHQRRASSRLRRASVKPRVETAAGDVMPKTAPRTVEPKALTTAELLQIGIKHHQAGRLTEAEACYRRLLAAQPDHADAVHLLGVIALQAGQSDVAVTLIQQALKQNSQDAAYFSNFGIALRMQGKLEEAAAAHRQAIRIKPDDAEFHFNLGSTLRMQGRLDEAAHVYGQAICFKPDHAEAHANLGIALHGTGKIREAAEACRQAIRIKPDYAEAHQYLGVMLYRERKIAEAIAAFRQAIRIKPNYAEAHCNLGAPLIDQGEVDQAIMSYRQAISLKPDLAMAHNNLGLALKQLGQLAEARTALLRAARLEPRNTKFHRDLIDVVDFAAGDPHLAEMEQLARDASLAVDERIDLHFALGKAYDDMGRHAEAFRQWLDGNALKRSQISYDEAATFRALNQTREVFSSEFVLRWQNAGHPSSVPVFIIGMPRSGTTLVEQILASHPQVFGGGELGHFLTALYSAQKRPGHSASFLKLVPGMKGGDFRNLGSHYLAQVQQLAPGASRITNKLPANFVLAGLIHLALPNAAIIHSIRDPLDTCLSCFSKLFADEQNNTYDLAELGRYYRRYQALMTHWRRVLPHGRILDVHYEDVVVDLEGQARRIVAHCGLAWDPRCLAFHKTKRLVRTASAAQVRQPIYNSAVGRWRAYEEFLGPLRAELGSSDDPF